MLDVVGQNYREGELLDAHAAKPSRKILGTENSHDLPVWLSLRDHPEYAGQFLWTGVDYLGEADWPVIGAGSGLIDRTGEIKPMGYQRQSWWSDKPMVYVARRTAPPTRSPTDPGYGAPMRRPDVLFSDWTPKIATPHNENVEVYSNCEEVELILNGKSIGKKPRPQDDSSRNWTVPYEAGALLAIGRNRGLEVARQAVRTAGIPTQINISIDPSAISTDWNDVARATVTVLDANGVICPNAENQITFHVTGPGTIAAVDSGSRIDHDPLIASTRKAFKGRCVAWVKASAPGQISISTTSPGLNSITTAILSATPSPGTPREGRGEGDSERRTSLDNRRAPSPSPGIPGEGTDRNTLIF
jgi:beta-galactosidase